MKHGTPHRCIPLLMAALALHSGRPAIAAPQPPEEKLARPTPAQAAWQDLELGPLNAGALDRATLDAWSAPFRGWHYHPDPVLPSDLKIPGHEKFHNLDVPAVYQVAGQSGKWFMSFIGFNGQGYNSFVAESTNLVQWTHPRLAMGFGPAGEGFLRLALVENEQRLRQAVRQIKGCLTKGATVAEGDQVA